MRDLLVVLFAHAAAHVVHKLDTIGHRVLVLLAEAREAHEAATHELAVERPLHVHGARQWQTTRQTVMQHGPSEYHEAFVLLLAVRRRRRVGVCAHKVGQLKLSLFEFDKAAIVRVKVAHNKANESGVEASSGAMLLLHFDSGHCGVARRGARGSCVVQIEGGRGNAQAERLEQARVQLTAVFGVKQRKLTRVISQLAFVDVD